MLKIAKVAVHESSRVYGDLAEKVAFSVDVNPVNIVASALGGYAATRTYDSIQDNQLKEELSKKTLENDHYENIQNILRDMRIVFTPINVVYSVNGQVFEIIKTSEMSPIMRKHFIAKDGEYFKQLLINKMNMELQLAEQIFAGRLIQQQLPPQFKTAGHCSLRWLEKVSLDSILNDFEGMEKKASSPFTLTVSLDGIRPLDCVGDFKLIEKVASYFTPSISESLSHQDLEQNIKVGFLPDRVIYTINGQLIEQLAVAHMNSLGYNAFKKRDKPFFVQFFLNESKRIESAVISDAAQDVVNTLDKNASLKEDLLTDFADRLTGKKSMDDPFSKVSNESEDEPEDDDWVNGFAEVLQSVPSDYDESMDYEDMDDIEDELEEEEKTAASLEEVRSSWTEQLAIDKEHIDLWRDVDVHPIAYDWLLDRKYGTDWHETDLSALLAQLMADFKLEEINSIVSDKLAFLQSVQTPKHSIYLSAFTFEKFARVMNSKTIDFTEYEGGLEFEELLFAWELVASLSDSDLVFYEFGDGVANHVAKLLKADGVRFISDQLYDETIEAERDFFEEVNAFLLRMWKEEDSRSVTGEEALVLRAKTVRINDVADTILRDYAEHLNPQTPYDAAEEVMKMKNHIWHLTIEEQEAVTQLVGRHVIASVFLELKRKELAITLSLLEEAGVENE